MFKLSGNTKIQPMASSEDLTEGESLKESSVDGSCDDFELNLKSVIVVKNSVTDGKPEVKYNQSLKSGCHQLMNGVANEIAAAETKMSTSDVIENRDVLNDDLNNTKTEDLTKMSVDSFHDVEAKQISVTEESNVKNELFEDDREFRTAPDLKECERSSSESDVGCEIVGKSSVVDGATVSDEKETSSMMKGNEFSEARATTSTNIVPSSSSFPDTSATLKPPPVGHRLELKHKRIESAPRKMSSNFNHRPVARLLINMGLEMVREEVIQNLIEIQKEKEKKQQLDNVEKSQLEKLEESLRNLVTKNEVYKVPVKRCRCKFLAFTDMALETHQQYGGSTRIQHYHCCICMKFRTGNAPKFVSHMGKEHQILARLLSIPQIQCPFCPFESRQSTLFDRHINSCRRKFLLSRNLVITQNIFDIPVYETLQKQRTNCAPVQTALNSHMGFPRTSGISGVAGMGDRAGVSGTVRAPTPVLNPNPFTGLSVASILSACGLSPQIQAQVLSNLSLQSTALAQGQGFPMPGFAPLPSMGPPLLPQLNPSIASLLPFGDGNFAAIGNSFLHPRPNLPLPGSLLALRNSVNHRKQNPNPPVPTVATSGRSTFGQQQKHLEQLYRETVLAHTSSAMEKKMMPSAQTAGTVLSRLDIPPMSLKCEICDLPSRDLESLRLHLVSLHHESLNRDEFHKRGRTLNCPSCAEKFWTKQGVTRHFAARHSSAEPRAYQCIRCGEKVHSSILNHLSSQHDFTVLDMYRAKFCMLCNRYFKTVNHFENHVVDAHADIFPNRLVLLTMIKALTAAYVYKTMGKPELKQQQLRPLMPSMGSSGSRPFLPRGIETLAQRMEKPVRVKPKGRFPCHDCCINFASAEELAEHCQRDHLIKCSRCAERWNSIELMQRHFQTKHHNEKDACILCGELVQIGRPTVRHIKRKHIRSCSVAVKRLHPKETMRYLTKHRRSGHAGGQSANSAGTELISNVAAAGEKSDSLFETRVEEIMEVDGERIVIEKNG